MSRLLLCLCALLISSWAHARQARVAVLELTMGKGTPTEAGGYLTDLVRTSALALPAKRYFILTRENLLEMLPPGQDLAACEGACEVETGRNIGADYVISGEIVTLGGALKVALKLFRSRDGRLLGARNASAPGAAELDDAVQLAADGVIELLRDAGPGTSRRRRRVTVSDTPIYAVGLWRVLITSGASPSLYIWQGADGRLALEIDTAANGWWRLKQGNRTLHVESAISQRGSILDRRPWRRISGEPTAVRVPIQKTWTNVHGKTKLELREGQITLDLPDLGKIRLSGEGTKVRYEDAAGKKRTF